MQISNKNSANSISQCDLFEFFDKSSIKKETANKEEAANKIDIRSLLYLLMKESLLKENDIDKTALLNVLNADKIREAKKFPLIKRAGTTPTFIDIDKFSKLIREKPCFKTPSLLFVNVKNLIQHYESSTIQNNHSKAKTYP